MWSLMRVKPLAEPFVLLSGIFKVPTKFGRSELICIPEVKLAKDLSLDLFGKLFFFDLFLDYFASFWAIVVFTFYINGVIPARKL